MAATFVAFVAATSAHAASVTRQGGFSTDVYWPLTCAEVCRIRSRPAHILDEFPLTDAEGLGWSYRRSNYRPRLSTRPGDLLMSRPQIARASRHRRPGGPRFQLQGERTL